MTKTQKLPKGWAYGEREARRKQLLKLPRRVRVLLAAEWARSVLSIFEAHRPDDNRPRKAIEAAESWVFDPSKRAASAAASADAAAYAAYAAAASADAAAYAAYAADADADAAYAAADAAAYAAYAADQQKRWRWIYATYRHAFGPLGLEFSPAWRTDTAVALARQMYESRDFGAMPILADALQDAGCTSAELIAHLQDDSEEWTRADWVLWNLMKLGEDRP